MTVGRLLLMVKRTLPVIKIKLIDIGYKIGGKLGQEIIDLALETVRRSPTRKRAITKHAPLTDEQKEAVRKMAFKHPELHLDEIAKLFATNPGRISEALRDGP